jgi:hypothetical protein
MPWPRLPALQPIPCLIATVPISTPPILSCSRCWLYLPADLLAHLQPYLQRMGELAGGRIDELAGIADRNPPTLEHRSRAGQDSQRIIKHPAYEELERIAYGEFGLQAISHREDMLGWRARCRPSSSTR